MAKTTEPKPAHIVLEPLQHDGVDHAPGDPAPASLTPEQAAALLAAGVIGPAV